MNLKKLFIGIILAAGAIAVSCEQEKPVFGISADQDVIEFPQGGGTAQVQVTTAQSWTVKIPSNAQDWLTADPASGTGSATITFTAAANAGKDRKTGLKINAGMAGYVSVTASQPGAVKPGDGLTAATAWSASEANAWIKANLADKQVTSEKYYIKGIIHKVQTTFAASGTYGNAVFFISDDGQAASDDFEAYQVYYLDGKQWKSGQPDVEVGDEVIIYGPVTLYGSTAETSGKGAAYIYSHLRNGEAPSGGGSGGSGDTDYSKAEAKTVAEFIAAADKNTYYKLTGKVSGFSANYCSFDLEDATGKIYVYSVLDSYKAEWASKIKNGGTITIAGKYDYYEKKTQHEVVNAAILAFEEGQGGEGGQTDYSQAPAKTVAEFIALADTENYYKLSGKVGGSINTTYGNYDITDDSGTIYVYGTANWSEWKDKVKDGSAVTLAAKFKMYNEKPEAVDAYILSCEGGSDNPGGGSGSGGGGETPSGEPTVKVDFTSVMDALPQGSSAGKQDGTYTFSGYEFIFHAADKFYQAKSNDQYYLLIGKANSYIQFPAISGKKLVAVMFLTGAAASENVIGDIAKADGTRLNVNNDKMKKGTEYVWNVSGEAGAAYRFVVTNAYNAQFQYLSLYYE